MRSTEGWGSIASLATSIISSLQPAVCISQGHEIVPVLVQACLILPQMGLCLGTTRAATYLSCQGHMLSRSAGCAVVPIISSAMEQLPTVW